MPRSAMPSGAPRGFLLVALLRAAPDASRAQDLVLPRTGTRERERRPVARSAASDQLPPGRYRVSIASFRVNHATDDDPLELDGKGGEVYLSVAIFETTDHAGVVHVAQGWKDHSPSPCSWCKRGRVTESLRRGSAIDRAQSCKADETLFVYPGRCQLHISKDPHLLG